MTAANTSESASSQKQDKPPAQQSKSLGFVTNLEEHVKEDWWKYIFNSLYMKTDGDVVDDDNITRNEIDFFSQVTGWKKDNHILDLCCGHGRHSTELARRGHLHVEGFDRSRYLIQRARAKVKKLGLKVKYREGDARKLPFPNDQFDFVTLLGNSLGYFETAQDDLKIFKEIFRILKPKGKVIIDVADGDYLREKFQPRTWEWIDKDLFVCRERSLSLDKQRLISREVITDVNEGVLSDQFYAERLYTPDTLGDILKEAGFTDIGPVGEMAPDTTKHQDLGMMEKRIIMLATCKKEWTKIPKRKSARKVTVVLGDPRKSDIIKPNSTFDDDDMDTIQRLKNALNEIDGYEFSYLDNHDTLVHDLTTKRGDIDYVLNLCDEGFNNSAVHELHVPSLLDVIGIPYTGGGPQCLAICYDKSLTRGLALEMDVPVPSAWLIKPEDTIMEIPIPFPVLVKPNFGDSSFGITTRSLCYNVEELSDAITEIRAKTGYEKPVLVEEFLSGKDLSVGILGNPPGHWRELPIIEEDYSQLPPELPRICGYEAKWELDGPYSVLKSIPAELNDATEKIIMTSCLRLFERLHCWDYSRYDWRIDSEGNPKLLEVNPNPGWCWDGHLTKMTGLIGMSYKETLAEILRAAEIRLGIRQSEEAAA